MNVTEVGVQLEKRVQGRRTGNGEHHLTTVQEMDASVLVGVHLKWAVSPEERGEATGESSQTFAFDVRRRCVLAQGLSQLKQKRPPVVPLHELLFNRFHDHGHEHDQAHLARPRRQLLSHTTKSKALVSL